MIDGVSVRRFDDGKVVHHARGVGQQVAHPRSGLSMLPKRPVRGSNGKMRLAGRHARQLLVAANGIRHVLVELGGQVRLVIEKIHLRRAARHEEIDRAFRFRRKVRQAESVASPPPMPTGRLLHPHSSAGPFHRRVPPARPTPAPSRTAPGIAAASRSQPTPASQPQGWEGPEESRDFRSRCKVDVASYSVPSYLLMVSSRLSISLATIVQAANSGSGMDASRFFSPISTRECAALGSSA